MELNQLLQFKTIVETGNMSRAAQTLFVSQPSLSHNIAKLEKELGAQLFEHRGNKLILNETGRRVLLHVNNIFDETNKIRLITGENAPASDMLRLGSYEEHCLRYFGASISDFFSDVTLFTCLMPDTELKQHLKSNKIDIAFSSSAIIDPDISTVYLCESSMSISVPPEHELFCRSSLTWKDLEGQCILVPSGFSYLRDKVAAIEKAKNIQTERLIQNDFGLYRILAEKSRFLCFSISLDQSGGPTRRRKIPISDPDITICYYASCLTSRMSELLPYINCIRQHF